eukprot:Nitzschia sp. Nitz4//scaffold280_size24494//10901//13189//NITZ4_008392-RA/size24494-processed-gene-0.19-mRNA-1//1//CDS//3329545591//8869//frame0
MSFLPKRRLSFYHDDTTSSSPRIARKKAKVTTHIEEASTLCKDATCHFKVGNYDQAEATFAKALCRLDIQNQHSALEQDGSFLRNSVKKGDQQKTEYDEGMRCSDTVLPIQGSHDEFLPSVEAQATLLYNIGQTNILRGDVCSGKRWFMKAFNQVLAATTGSGKSILKVRILFGLGYCEYAATLKNVDDEKAMVNAQHYYELALSLIQALGLGDEYLAAALNCIAVVQFNQRNRSDEVLKTFQASAALYDTKYSTIAHESSRTTTCQVNSIPLGARLATVWNNIGRMHYLRSEFELSVIAYQKSLQLKKENLSSDSIDIAATVYNIAQVHQQLGQLDLALDRYEEFVDIATARGSPPKDVSYAYKGIAEIRRVKKQPDLTVEFLLKALEVETLASGKTTAEVANTYNKLGNACYELKEYQRAIDFYEQGLAIEKEICGRGSETNDEAIKVTLTNLGHVHKQVGEYVRALHYYKQAFKAHQSGSSLAEGIHPMAIETLSNIGLMEYHLHKYDSAFDTYQVVLRVRRQQYKLEHPEDSSDAHPDIASTLNSLGLVLFKKHSFELAQHCFEESLRIRTVLYGKNHAEVAILWYNLATIHFERGNHEIAIEYYNETLRVERAALGEEHPDVSLTIQHLGQVYQQLGMFDQAAEHFNQALEIERNRNMSSATEIIKDHTGRDVPNKACARILNLLGNVYLQLGKTRDMMLCFTEASRYYQSKAHEPQESRRAHPNLSSRQPMENVLIIAGFTMYGLSKSNPPCAPMA